MKRLLIGCACLLGLFGCANHTVVPPKVVSNVEAPAPNWRVVSGKNYSFSLPASFIDVKKSAETLIDSSFASPDHFLIVSAATDSSDEPIELYAIGIAQIMIANGSELIDHRTGKFAGLTAELFVMGIDRKAIALYLMAKDKTDTVYLMSCLFNPLMLKTYAPVCAEISRTFILLPKREQ